MTLIYLPLPLQPEEKKATAVIRVAISEITKIKLPPWLTESEFLVWCADEARTLLLARAGVACGSCKGKGVLLRGETCPDCWGTGRTDQTGPNLDKFEERVKKAHATECRAWFAARIGANLNICSRHFGTIAKELRAIEWPDDKWLRNTVEAIAVLLDEMAEVAK